MGYFNAVETSDLAVKIVMLFLMFEARGDAIFCCCMSSVGTIRRAFPTERKETVGGLYGIG